MDLNLNGTDWWVPEGHSWNKVKYCSEIKFFLHVKVKKILLLPLAFKQIVYCEFDFVSCWLTHAQKQVWLLRLTLLYSAITALVVYSQPEYCSIHRIYWNLSLWSHGTLYLMSAVQIMSSSVSIKLLMCTSGICQATSAQEGEWLKTSHGRGHSWASFIFVCERGSTPCFGWGIHRVRK